MRLVTLDGVRYLLDCSQEYFNSILPAIKSDIQMMKDSQIGEQKWFNRESKWKIHEQYGTVTAKIFGPKPEKGKEELKLRDESEYSVPVPVYELWDQTLFKKFWVNLGLFWDSPSTWQDVPDSEWRNRNTVEFRNMKAKFDTELFKLRRVGFSNGSVSFSDEDTTMGSGHTDLPWSPVVHYPTAAEILGEGTWYGPNPFGTYWKGYVGSNEKATIYGAFSNIFAPDTYTWNYRVYYWSTIGGTDVITGVKDEQFAGPLIKLDTYDNGYTVNITINSIPIYSGRLISTIETAGYFFDYIDLVFPNPETVVAYSNSVSTIGGESATTLIDVATVSDESYYDYEAWCVVLGIDSYTYKEVYDTINPWDYTDSNLPDDPGYTISLVVKALIPDKDGNVTEYIVYEGESYTNLSGIAEYPSSDHCEIYDFFGVPVYVFTVYIERQDLSTYVWLPHKFIYSMIYNGEIYTSEIFEETSVSSYDVNVYNSESLFGLYSSTTCRAVGMKTMAESSQTIPLEA